MQSYNGSLKKRFWGVNYQLVGKELAEDLKFLPQNPWNENASFRQRGPEKQENARKKIYGGGQDLKDHWSLA